MRKLYKIWGQLNWWLYISDTSREEKGVLLFTGQCSVGQLIQIDFSRSKIFIYLPISSEISVSTNLKWNIYIHQFGQIWKRNFSNLLCAPLSFIVFRSVCLMLMSPLTLIKCLKGQNLSDQIRDQRKLLKNYWKTNSFQTKCWIS